MTAGRRIGLGTRSALYFVKTENGENRVRRRRVVTGKGDENKP